MKNRTEVTLADSSLGVSAHEDTAYSDEGGCGKGRLVLHTI